MESFWWVSTIRNDCSSGAWGSGLGNADMHTHTHKNPPLKESLTSYTSVLEDPGYNSMVNSNLSTLLLWQHMEKISSWHALRSQRLPCYSLLKYGSIQENNNILYLQPVKCGRKILLWVQQRNKDQGIRKLRRRQITGR